MSLGALALWIECDSVSLIMNPYSILTSMTLADRSDDRSELVGKPAVVDIPVGKGHVVMFATNPMWRHQTQGEFFLLFNAALHFNHLSAGVSERGMRPQPAAGNNDEDNQ